MERDIVERNIEVYVAKLGNPAIGTTLHCSVPRSRIVTDPCATYLFPDSVVSRLTTLIESKAKSNIAVELRDSLEQLCSGPNYPVFLAKLWPVFKKILSGEPVFVSMSWEQVR
jgi:hypothetical protein